MQLAAELRLMATSAAFMHKAEKLREAAQCIADLEAKNKAMEENLAIWKADTQVIVEQNRNLKAKKKELEALLQRYGDHKRDCGYFIKDRNDDCCCGWSNIKH